MTSYGYDELYRLEKAAPPAGDNETFTYDEAGNRLTYKNGGTWQYNQNNELLDDNETFYSYDSRGNMISLTTG